MPSPLAFGDCGGVLDCGLRPGVNANTVDVKHAVFDYRTGIVMVDGRRFPFMIHEDGPTVEVNGDGYPVVLTVPAVFLVDDLYIGGAPRGGRS
ncbi:hypothetical protein [Mycobacteroides abscessus]|uniref:hypothetical protein n=1 Tax=Mycobacteroides abscessus TaxID=36809 RepID=UPI00092C7F06|nr:hypothetical protein [Mycobacteroides abscessus]SIL74260.1 Uncharacterised protein [Mycobacteroides abscessus subsp. abscessus]SLC85451.1 Uncharacterised protein [Mycobacteroides abscessus subsp. abscessus]